MYYSDYPKEKIKHKSNPYYCCSFCKVSDPEINGELKGHHSWCAYRISKEKDLMYGDLESGKVYVLFYCTSDRYTYSDERIVGIFTNKDKAETAFLEKQEEFPETDYRHHEIREIDLNKLDESVY